MKLQYIQAAIPMVSFAPDLQTAFNEGQKHPSAGPMKTSPTGHPCYEHTVRDELLNGMLRVQIYQITFYPDKDEVVDMNIMRAIVHVYSFQFLLRTHSAASKIDVCPTMNCEPFVSALNRKEDYRYYVSRDPVCPTFVIADRSHRVLMKIDKTHRRLEHA